MPRRCSLLVVLTMAYTCLCQSNTVTAFQPLSTSTTAAARTSAAIRRSARTTNTPLFSRSSEDNNKEDDDDDDDDDEDDTVNFMKSLQSRVSQVQQQDSQLPIVVLDTMLPGQRLQIEVENDTFQRLVKHCIELERPRFGMVGVATLSQTNQAMPLQNGVEVELSGTPQVVDAKSNSGDSGSEDSSDSGGKLKALRVTLVAGRRFRIDSNSLTTHPVGGWTEAKVQFMIPQPGDGRIDDDDDDAVEEDTRASQTITEPKDPLSLARAMQLARQMTKGEPHLIDQWIALARTKQQFDGQIDTLLDDLGPRPPVTSPTKLAFWIGALINPLPGMGVAMEIRPQLLMANQAEERIGVAFSAMEASIAHMDGSQPLF